MQKIIVVVLCCLLNSCAAVNPLVLLDANTMSCSLPYTSIDRQFYSGGVCQFYEDEGTYEIIFVPKDEAHYLKVNFQSPRSIESIADPNIDPLLALMIRKSSFKASEEHLILIKLRDINAPYFLWVLETLKDTKYINYLQAYISSAYFNRFFDYVVDSSTVCYRLGLPCFIER